MALPETGVEITNEQIVEHLKSNDPLVIDLIQKFNVVIDDLEALKNDAWLNHAIKGLDKPDLTVRIEKQVRTSVTKKMLNESYENLGDGETITPPTKDQIEAAVKIKLEERRYEIQSAKDVKVTKAKAALSSSG